MKNAVICADELFREFVPLSLEKPKGLWEVRGERLIERLIRQAKEAEAEKITVILGYKKERFLYLGEAFGVDFKENENFRNQSGPEALAEKDAEGAVIVSSGDYYIENPFLKETAKEAERAEIGTVGELRKFDERYQLYSGSEVIRNIRLVFRCEEDEIVNFRFLDRQQTNSSFTFEIKGTTYIYRYPAEGIEESVSWKNEKQSMLIAKELGIDKTYIYADFREGWKIMEFIGPHGKPDYASFEDSKKILEVLRRLHSADVRTDFGMEPWEDAEKMLVNLEKAKPGDFAPYEGLREKIRKLYEKTVGDGVQKCFCHGDTYRPNWMMMPDGSVILIDWEYAGYSDPGVDVGYYIADACYEMDEAEAFIREYLQDSCTDKKLFHFLVYSALIAYYWFIWARYRRVLGEPREDIEKKYGIMAQKYADLLLLRQDG